MVECWLPYGDTEVYVTVNVRDLLSVAEPVRQDPQSTAKEIILEALRDPRCVKRMGEFKGSDCVIALEGTTNPQVAVDVLATLIEQLVNLILMTKDKITIIVANGAREKSNRDLIKRIKSSDELKDCNLLEQTRNTMNLSNNGETKLKTPLLSNRVYSEAGIKIAVGDVGVDFYTGFRGAHTALLPGICSPITIEANRRLMFKGEIRPGVIELNPIKEDALEAVKILGCNLAIQLVSNQQGRLLSAYAGDIEETWGQAIYALGSSYQINAEAGADIVVISAGGAKYDFDLYSSTWALRAATRLVRKNGAVILLAECPEGLGTETYSNMAHIEQKAELERRYALGAEALMVLKDTTAKCRVLLVSSLPRYMVEPLGITVVRTANEAYEKAVEAIRGRKTLIIPYGCSTTPIGI